MKKELLCLVIIVFLSFLLMACDDTVTDVNGDTDGEPVDADDSEELVHSNIDEFTFIEPAGSKVDLNAYYAEYGVDSTSNITSLGGAIEVSGLPEELPSPKENYTIGLALYYTVDEVGAFVLEGTKEFAEMLGIELLISDADYDQNIQNQAIEQWILQGVDGVILYPADFSAVGPILGQLNDNGIPVIGGNPPLVGEVDSVILIDNVEIGRKSAEFVIDALNEKGLELAGTVVLQTLPFLHPNAETREAGFIEVMDQYPEIEVITLTGISPEEHYTAFEGALQAHSDLLAGWGLYSSAVIGMSNARTAAEATDVVIVGVDNDRPIMAGIKNGDIAGSVGYSAYNHAYWSMSNMVNLLNGVEVPGAITVPIDVINKDNVADLFEIYYGGRTLEDYMSGN